MPPAPLRLLCLWLCSEAVVSQLHWQKSKATFSPHYESAAADGNAQSRGWRTVRAADNEGTRGRSSRASWPDTVNRPSPELLPTEVHRRAVRKSDAQNGHGQEALHTGGDETGEPRRGGCVQGEILQHTRHGSTCVPASTGHSRRQRWSAKPGRMNHSGPLRDGAAAAWEALPAAMAQEQEAGPPDGLNTSDYEEEYSLPDFPEPSPLAPVNTRTRRRQVRNPFFPVTAETWGAYVVTILAVVIFSLGILGNVSVMCIVCHNYYMRSISNSLLANLALWDFVIVFFCLPLVVFHELTKNWLLGEFSCRIIPYLEVRGWGGGARGQCLNAREVCRTGLMRIMSLKCNAPNRFIEFLRLVTEQDQINSTGLRGNHVSHRAAEVRMLKTVQCIVIYFSIQQA